MPSIIKAMLFHAQTLWLFTKSDYKTIFFPVGVFASVAAPLSSPRGLANTIFWVLAHLLQANVSNQTYSGHEDKVNKPWRPIPSGRITPGQARILRWLLLVACLLQSAIFGWRVFITSLALSVVEILYDDLGFCGSLLSRTLLNVGGYLTFELGATLIMSPTLELDQTAGTALKSSALIIFTTIHAQDFADVHGDALSGRRTLPIVAPTGSRIYMFGILIAWSVALVRLWGLGPVSAASFLILGIVVGTRYLCLRRVADDERTYLLYNLWLLSAHLLPINARVPILS